MHQQVSYSFEELPEREALLQSSQRRDKTLAVAAEDEKQPVFILADLSFGEE